MNTTALKRSSPLTGVKGMNDILPANSYAWEWLEAKVRALMARHAYFNIRTPIIENTALFVRGIGAATDIVEKEMYSFTDALNGDQLSLRPENTAAVVRAVVQNNLLYDGGKRLYYIGPMFRHERPQRGRYRQFHQIGAEALGFAGPEVDAELILMACALWQELGLHDVRLEINSLGQPEERRAHRLALQTYFEAQKAQLDEDALRRLHTNPLRILDSKNPAMQAMIEAAPKLLDYLGPESLVHLHAVQSILDAHGVDWVINPRLVRGLDYYNLTVFEFITTSLGSQGTICGGGRYDYLVEEIGGKPAPAVGWSIGIERVLELLKEQGKLPPPQELDAYAIVADTAYLVQVLPILTTLRRLGVRIQLQTSTAQGMPSLKSQFKKADASGARYALVFGADEMAAQALAVKPLREQGEQSCHSMAELAGLATYLQQNRLPH